MNNDTDPVLFTDRIPVSTVGEYSQELLLTMRKQELIKVDDIIVNFCGLVSSTSGIAVFMPRNTDISTIKNPKQAAANLFFALTRYFRDRNTALYTSDNEEERHGDCQLGLILELLRDFSLNGLYSQRITERILNCGKTDWKRTINHENPFSGQKGPVYLNLSGTRRRYLSDCETARIHAEVIRELDSLFGWAVTGGRPISEGSLQQVPEPLGDNGNKISNLEKALGIAYSDRDIFLIGALLQYLRKRQGEQLSELVIGVRQFHSMWENMLDTCLQWTMKVNQYLAAPVYKIRGKYYLAARKGQRTDTVLEHPDKKVFTVVDAKYYGAADLESSPGWPDLVKQFYYAKAMKQLHEDATIYNAFVFPGAEGPIESAHMATRGENQVTENDLLNDDYPVIDCVYLDPLELLDCYVNGKKLNTLSQQLLKTKNEDLG